ncbi:hydroxyneurosporene-O-methyltransferase [Stanieria sp. NIES-3757]|nr:hydroxyneurosporene-O-methyltransferase [Stanieria sp. NIES-3757]
MNKPEVPPFMTMVEMISSFWVSRAIYIVAKLGIADLLEEQPQTAEKLAELTDTHAPSLYRLLRALASVGIVVEDERRHFALTPLGDTLRTNAPNSLRFFAIAELGSDHYLGWGNLLHSIKTGEIAFDNVARMNIWEYYQQHPEDGKPFERAMTNVTKTILETVLTSYDFSGFSRVVDVGGGRGSLLAAILQSNLSVRGVLFDLPTVIDSAKTIFESEGLRDRCDLVAGDFFTSVPTGGDAYLLKWIIHDWEEAKALTILKNCHQAMVDGGKLLLFEQVIPTGNEPNFAKLLDLNMLVMTGGRERTEAEYQTLLQLAGFKLTRIVATDSPTSIIEAVKN